MLRNLQKISSPFFRKIPFCFGTIKPETPTPSKPSYLSEKWYNTIPKHKMMVYLKEETHHMVHPIFALEDIEKVGLNHHPINGFSDRFAFVMIQIFRKFFDYFTRYDPKNMSENKFLFRFILLETVAGLPGKNQLNIYYLISYIKQEWFQLCVDILEVFD